MLEMLTFSLFELQGILRKKKKRAINSCFGNGKGWHFFNTEVKWSEGPKVLISTLRAIVTAAAAGERCTCKPQGTWRLRALQRPRRSVPPAPFLNV